MGQNSLFVNAILSGLVTMEGVLTCSASERPPFLVAYLNFARLYHLSALTPGYSGLEQLLIGLISQTTAFYSGYSFSNLLWLPPSRHVHGFPPGHRSSSPHPTWISYNGRFFKNIYLFPWMQKTSGPLSFRFLAVTAWYPETPPLL